VTTARIEATAEPARTLGLRDVLGFLRRGALLAGFVAAVAGASAYLLSSASDPVYRAAVTLVASQPGSSPAGLVLITPPVVDPAVYRSAILEGSIVADAMTRVTGVRPSEQALERFLRRVRVSVENQQISSLIRIEVEGSDPEQTAALANAISDGLVAWDRLRAQRNLARGIDALEQALAEIDAELAAGGTPERLATLQAVRDERQVDLDLANAMSASALFVGLLDPLRTASAPERAVGPRLVFNTFVAVLLGLILGYGMLFVRVALDTGVGSAAAVSTTTGLPVLAEFAHRSRTDTLHSPETVSFLRTNLMLAIQGDGPRVLVVTSAQDAAEKDRVAASLAASLARGGNRTLRVDADLRNFATTRWLDLSPNSAAPLEVQLANPSQRYPPVNIVVGSRLGFDFVPSFTAAPFPVDALNQGLPSLLETWRAQYDVIILDTTPVVSFADTLAIAPLATGVVLCASARRSTREGLVEAIRVLGRAQVRLLGVVLTEVPASRARRAVSANQAQAAARRVADPFATAMDKEPSPRGRSR
jgi:Mrp family chromosome partitioning ATPase